MAGGMLLSGESGWLGYSSTHPAVIPKPACDWSWIKVDGGPPHCLISGPVKLAVMKSAKGDRELVADAPPECRTLSKAQVMGIGRLTPADKTRL